MHKKHLIENGFDGLYYPGECGCEVSDLAPCGEGSLSCKPGYKHMDPRPGHPGEWAIFGKKETPTGEDWENVWC